MAPEYGATCGFFPIDKETIKYLKILEETKVIAQWLKNMQKNKTSGMNTMQYLKINYLYNEEIDIDISKIQPVLAGPKRPQDKVLLNNVHKKVCQLLKKNNNLEIKKSKKLKNGDIVLAAITSCTNTANPYLMIAAALLAKKAYEVGL